MYTTSDAKPLWFLAGAARGGQHSSAARLDAVQAGGASLGELQGQQPRLHQLAQLCQQLQLAIGASGGGPGPAAADSSQLAP